MVAASTHAAVADPVAAAGTPPPGGEPSTRDARTRTPDDEPDPAALAAAPAADRASGIVVAPPEERHPIANTLLAIPRLTAEVLFTGPRYAAAELDDYLESRSPNAFGRDVHSSWRFGAAVDWETALHTSLGARVGRELGDHVSVDGYAGVLGARGQSAGLVAKLGDYTSRHLQPSLTFDAGREMQRAFAGVGDHGPRVVYDRDELVVAAALDAHDGPLEMRARVITETVRDRDDDGDIAMAYTALPVGIDETQQAVSGELSVAFDSRRRGYPWVRAAAPSEGTLIRLTGAYTRGRGSDTDGFAFGRGILEARQLFDLFHGDRVLSIGVRGEVISADAAEVPFDRLASLGGRDMLRAFARDELRDAASAFAEVMYEWPLAADSHGYLFVETGAVEPGVMDATSSRLHVGYGGGIRMLSGAATWARLQIAGADDGVLGMYLQLGAL